MAGVVFKTKFVEAGNNAFKSYIGYIDRSEAVRKDADNKYDLFNEYMGNPEKTTGLFTEDKDLLSDMQKAELKEVFSSAQKKGSLMYQSIFSFEREWLLEQNLIDENGVLNEAKMKEYTRVSMGALLKAENMENFCWSAAIHYNTDHFHIHIAYVDPEPSWEEGKGRCYRNVNGELAQRGKFKQSSIEKTKSAFVNMAIKSKESNERINDILRNKMIAGKKGIEISREAELCKDMQNLMSHLPKDMRQWKYGMNVMQPLRPEIDKITDKFIELYFKDEFDEYVEEIGELSAKYRSAYGESREANKFIKGKMTDMYYRMGNAILSECKEIEKEYRAGIRDRFVAGDVKDTEKEGLGNYVREKFEENIKIDDMVENTKDIKEDMAIDSDEFVDIPIGYYMKWSDGYIDARKLVYERKYKEGYEKLLREAKCGNALAIYEIGSMYQYGRGVEIDITLANEYYKSAYDLFLDLFKRECASDFEKNYAAFRLGKMNHYGLGVEKDTAKAAEYYRKIPDNVYAAYALGNLYFSGDGVEKNIEKAIELYQNAAQGKSVNPYAAYKLGGLYEKGYEDDEIEFKIGQDKKEADKFYRLAFGGFKSMYDKGGDENIVYRLGTMYLYGKGVKQDEKMAEKLFEEAAELGNPYAQYELSKIYLSSEEPSEKDIEKALTMLNMAATKGMNVAAQYFLGRIYSNNEYGIKDLEKAIYWLNKALENGNGFAAYVLGKIYLSEDNECCDKDIAVRYFTQSAARGNEYAQYTLGKLYMDPESGYYDPEEGERLLKESAEQGNEYAQYALGSAYVDRRSGIYNKNKGMEILIGLAEKGNENAQMKLGFIYLQGDVVSQDIDKAVKWFKKAADNGNKTAKDIIAGRYRSPIHFRKSIWNLRKVLQKDIQSLKNQAAYERFMKEQE